MCSIASSLTIQANHFEEMKAVIPPLLYNEKRKEKAIDEEKFIDWTLMYHVCRKLHFDRIKQLQDIVILQNNLGDPYELTQN